MKKLSLAFIFLIFSIFLVYFPQIEVVKAQDSTIYIRDDGTVEGTDKIRIDGNVYTLVEDLSCSIDIMDVFITIEKDNIVFDGAQKTIQGTGNGIGIEARGRINITIQNLRIINFGIGIELRLKDFESKSIASNNQILNNHVDTRYFSMNLNTENGKISENTLISRTHKYGVLFNCNNTVFSNNEFINSGLIIYEPCNGNVFFGNTINSKPVVYLENSSDQIIDDCVQVFLTDCNNITVRNVNTTADLRITITLFGTKNSKITNCKGNILLRNSDNNNIIGNQLEEVDSGVSFNSAAIELSNSNNNTISDNLIYTTGSQGISLIGSSYNNLKGNQIFSSGQAGIIIESTVESLSVFNYINENNISCTENGIYFKGDPRNNIVFKNIITECKNAIMLSSGHENIFFGNNISRNTQYAVYLSRADNNTFYQNNFVENLVSVYEQHQFYYPFPDSYYSQNNLWDNGQEGNYWSNYVGSDSDGDGVGDSPHLVYENKSDNYPLINPVDIKVIPENNLTLFGFLFLGIILLTIKLVYIRKEKMNKSKLAYTILFILCLVIPTPLAFATDDDSWITLAPLPNSSSFTIGVAVVDGKIYRIGWSSCEKYDPETNNWTSVASVPVYSGGTVVVHQNKIYIIGGNPTQVYDPDTNTWENRTSIPITRMSLQANVVDSKIYLVGGRFPAGLYQIVLSSSNDVYDPATDSWSQMAPIPVPVMGYASAVLDDKIYIISGGTNDSEYIPTNLIQIFDPATNQWTNGTQIPVVACYSRACVTTGLMAPKRIYVIGGTNTAYDRSAYYNVMNLNQMYDPATDTWTSCSPMLTPRCDFGIAVVNDEIYAIGGIREENLQMIENEKYTPAGYIPEFPFWSPFLILGLIATLMVSIIYRRRFIQEIRK